MQFKVPLVPYIPALSIFCNIELMVHLSALTWIRFFVWLVIGMLMYFCYGIHHSKEATLDTSYSMLLNSSKVIRGNYWGVTAKSTISRIFSQGRQKSEDKTIIIEKEDS